MDRRALLAVILSLLVLVAYEQFLRHYYRPPEGPETAPSPRASSALEEHAATPAQTARQTPQDATTKLDEPAEEQALERIVRVETPLYTTLFSTRGARLVSFRLKKYRTTVDPGSPPLELIIPGVEGDAPFSLELRGRDGAPLWKDTRVAYETGAGDVVELAEGTGSLRFRTQVRGGTVTKQFLFDPASYIIRAEISLEQPPSEASEVGVSWSRSAEPKNAREHVFTKAAYLQGKKLLEPPFSELDKGVVVEGDIRWTAFSGSYFLAALALEEAEAPRLWLKNRGLVIEQSVLIPVRAPATNVVLTAYLGPKDIDALELAGHDFRRAVDLGWFGFIAVPLLHVMQFSHRFTGNYGFDIILLTLLVKILFIPLTNRSFKSMRELQRLQPEMLRIREKYKDDPQQMNKEMLELYRRHKVNPLGGCLPMLLQLPVFIGLYSALTHAVELRHAPFILWITDLSAPDRLGSVAIPLVEPPGVPVLTLLMGASMFLQTWMSPSTGDPAQRNVMLIMPVMFTFMFINFPSGLTLYWLVNNVLTIAQQYYMTRKTLN